jgi:hypothetical protein
VRLLADIRPCQGQTLGQARISFQFSSFNQQAAFVPAFMPSCSLLPVSITFFKFPLPGVLNASALGE